MSIPPEAIAAQHRASDPRWSVWVSANAGAGKTTVLAQRVVRLLLDGVPPRAILCLTFTNAAAAEMATRVFKELAALATLPDATLMEKVAILAPEADPATAARRARTLFAETLETPGGLKVQTLHAFAAALLRRFPLEANVSGAFTLLDDALREELTDRAIAIVLGRAVAAPAGPEAEAIAALLPHVSDARLGDAIKAALAERDALVNWAGAGGPARLAADLRAALADTASAHGITWTDDECRTLIADLERAGVGSALARDLAAALGCEAVERDLAWRTIFLTKEGEPRSLRSLTPKAVQAAFPDLSARIEAEQARLVALDAAERADQAIAATLPLVQLAWAAHGVLEEEKRRRGLIDYDDQITRATNLVNSAGAAAWVRYKLDEGIDHVMVDEAQDTSPEQWQLVGALVSEFFAGAGAKDVHRTLFVVGDEKQSIYSFQGAAPKLFAEKRAAYNAAAAGAGASFAAVDLLHSFRSAPQVLSAVDRVFAAPDLAAAVGATAGSVRHAPVRPGPGGVDVWPLFADLETERPDAWDAPFDAAPENAGTVRLVTAIADRIEAWTREGPDGGPPVRPGEIMILSRKREPLATLMNRELKRRGIPSAGSDRLCVTEHIAVQDMLALARALLSPDDLSLAAVLKSPLFDLSEDELFAVAHGREGSLLAALAQGDAKARAAHDTLRRWQAAARTERPLDLLAGILIGEGRRADFAARMGGAAEDALDALLDIALDAETSGVPTLETFLSRLSRTRVELRRAAEGGGDVVRVMTVHGAKGLEAEVVFLADVGSTAKGRNGPTLARVPSPMGEALVFAPTKEHRPDAVAAQLEAEDAAEIAEHHRLLYVGMTRAKRHLVICGAFGKNKPAEHMWHGLVHAALKGGSTPLDTPAGPGLAWRDPAPAAWPVRDGMAGAAAPAEETPIPSWARTPAVFRRNAPERLTPSGDHTPSASGAPPSPSGLPAAQRGLLVHALLEHDDDEPAMAARLLRLAPDVAAADRAAIAAEAAAARALPQLAWGTVHREVDIAGDIRADGGVRRVTGRIDRIQTDGRRTLVVDWKTDRLVPATPAGVPEGYRRQLGLYHALLSELLPGHVIETAIVWTADAVFMPMNAAVIRPAPAANGRAA